MASSQYYYSEMNQAAQERRRLQDKKIEFEHYKEKLENLKRAVSPASVEISSAGNAFANGGYIVDGETLDKGKLKDNASKLEQAMRDLSSVINRTQSEINNLESNIRRADSEYESAKSAYYRALAREEEERRAAAQGG